LVVELLERAAAHSAPRILDVGTGSGCIAVATAVNQQAAIVTAIDLSEAALDVARRNAEAHRVFERISFLQGDLLKPLDADARFDVITSNPPYVADAELDTLPADIRDHEPHLALFSGPDGTQLIRRLILEAPRHLAPGGFLLMEISPEQASAVESALRDASCYRDVRTVKDLSGNPRVALARVANDSE
jgi:release factor glutamine methyltransferase